MKNLIEKYRTELEQNLYDHCNIFCTIGIPIETPRYYNFGEVYENNNIFYLRIESTQSNKLFFDIEITENEFYQLSGNTQDFWNAFKEFRTEFLTKNYPTIKL